MKSSVKILCFFGTLLLLAIPGKLMAEDDENASKKNIVITSGPELADLVGEWVNAYTESYPESRIIFQRDGKDVENSELSPSKISFLSGNEIQKTQNIDSWRLVIAKDIIIPVMNAENPLREEIMKKGLSSSDFATVFSSSGGELWSKLAGGSHPEKVKALLPADGSCQPFVCSFMKTEASEFHCEQIADVREMFSVLENDRNAIAFCRLSDLQAFRNEHNESSIIFIPIDLNNDNQIDQFENIYAGNEDLLRGVWIGKYPKELYNRIYAVAENPPKDEEETAFLGWILSEGQGFLSSNGLSELSYYETQSGMKSLNASNLPLADMTSSSSFNMGWITIAGLILLAGAVLFLFTRPFRKSSLHHLPQEGKMVLSFNAENLRIPRGLFYDRSHSWIFMEKEGFVKTGIDDFLPQVTGTVTTVKMKNPGDTVKKGEVYFSLVQDGKQIDILSPLDGTIRDRNKELFTDAELINLDPFGKGWIYSVEADSWSKEMKNYLMYEKYREWISSEFTRFRDFLARVMNDKGNARLQPVLQEGGELWTGMLRDANPEVWEEFQQSFIDLCR